MSFNTYTPAPVQIDTLRKAMIWQFKPTYTELVTFTTPLGDLRTSSIQTHYLLLPSRAVPV